VQGKGEILRLLPLFVFQSKQNKGLPVTREVLMSKAKNVFKTVIYLYRLVVDGKKSL
jgi:hypothetical protein